MPSQDSGKKHRYLLTAWVVILLLMSRVLFIAVTGSL